MNTLQSKKAPRYSNQMLLQKSPKYFAPISVGILLGVGVGFMLGWYSREPRLTKDLELKILACLADPRTITADSVTLNLNCGETLGVHPALKPRKNPPEIKKDSLGPVAELEKRQ